MRLDVGYRASALPRNVVELAIVGTPREGPARHVARKAASCRDDDVLVTPSDPEPLGPGHLPPGAAHGAPCSRARPDSTAAANAS
jgi:hypothetical protein